MTSFHQSRQANPCHILCFFSLGLGSSLPLVFGIGMGLTVLNDTDWISETGKDLISVKIGNWSFGSAESRT